MSSVYVYLFPDKITTICSIGLMSGEILHTMVALPIQQGGPYQLTRWTLQPNRMWPISLLGPEFLKVTVSRSCNRAKKSDLAQNLEICTHKLSVYAFNPFYSFFFMFHTY